MPAALFALLLLVATIDPRLVEPLRLLSELRDASVRPIGADDGDLPRILNLTLAVAPLPPGAGGHYESRTVACSQPAWRTSYSTPATSIW